MPNSYEDLTVWTQAVELAAEIYRATECFPKRETYGLTNQLRRAIVSVPSNIAEGKGRSDADFARYLLQARGSLWEADTQVVLAGRFGFLPPERIVVLRKSIDVVGRMLSSLIKAVRP